MSSIRKSLRTPRFSNDASQLSSAKASKKQQREQLLEYVPKTGRRGAPQVFPRKLFQILEEEDENVIGWTNHHGTSFTIYDMDYFTEHVLLNYFRHQKYSSFQRQLNLYGFHKISKGPETGAYAHDCFLRDKPELLMGVRRLPQRVAAAVSKIRLNSKGNNKIVIKQRGTSTKPTSSKKQGAFAKLTACIKPRSINHGHHESSSDSYSSYSSDGDESDVEEGEDNAPRVPLPPSLGFRDIIDGSVDSFAQADEIDFFGLSEGGEEAYASTLDSLEQDGIVQVQPLPKECIIDKSAKVVDGISEGVNQLMLERSPIAMAKTVKIPESSRSWSVQTVSAPCHLSMKKPQSPTTSGGLQKMIPMLVRAGSSAFAIGKEVKVASCDDDMMKSVIDDLQNIESSMVSSGTLTRSKSSLMIEKIEKELMPMPSSMNQRLTSEVWNFELATGSTGTNLNDQDLFALGQLDTLFTRQESCDIVPPKPVEMER